MVGFIISPRVMDMPLAMAAADPNASEILEAMENFHYRRSLAGRSGPDLVLRASTRFPFGHMIFRTKRRNTHARADLFKIALRESTKRSRDGAVALQQKQRWNRRDAVSVAGRVIFAR